MSNEDRTTVAEVAVTASQRRHLFEELIGATPEKNHGLWWALDQVIVAALDTRDWETEEQVAELAHHFPGLETAILLAWAHIQRSDPAKLCGVCDPGEPAPVAADGAS